MCKVCDLCYKLVITDQELSELEKVIAITMNIQSDGIDKDTRFENKLVKKKENLKTEIGKNLDSYKVKNIKTLNSDLKLTQFRILFYFIRAYKLNITDIELEPDTEYKLHIKLFDQRFSIPIFDDKNKFVSEDEISLNLSKLFYFFTSDVSSLKSIIKNEVVDFRIVKNDNYNNPFAQCQTQCFFFYSDNGTKTFTIKNIFNFFSDEVNFFKMQIYIGITNDGEVVNLNSSNDFVLYNYKMLGNIYITNPSYYSHHPLPDDWHELFMPEGKDFKDIQQEEANAIESNINEIIKNLGFKELNYIKRSNRDKLKYDLKDYKTTVNYNNKNLDDNHNNNMILEENEDIYDPYDLLIKMQNKKTTISRIKSIAMLQDKEPWEDKVNLKKERPLTSSLIKKFNINPSTLHNNLNKLNKNNYDTSISSSSNNKNYNKKLFDESTKLKNNNNNYSIKNNKHKLNKNSIIHKNSMSNNESYSVSLINNSK